jgi:hypothetical protein
MVDYQRNFQFVEILAKILQELKGPLQEFGEGCYVNKNGNDGGV